MSDAFLAMDPLDSSSAGDLPAAQPLSTDQYLKADLPHAVGIPLAMIAELLLMGLFPTATCHAVVGPSWNADEVNTFAADLARLQDPISHVLNPEYRP